MSKTQTKRLTELQARAWIETNTYYFRNPSPDNLLHFAKVRTTGATLKDADERWYSLKFVDGMYELSKI